MCPTSGHYKLHHASTTCEISRKCDTDNRKIDGIPVKCIEVLFNAIRSTFIIFVVIDSSYRPLCRCAFLLCVGNINRNPH